MGVARPQVALAFLHEKDRLEDSLEALTTCGLAAESLGVLGRLTPLKTILGESFVGSPARGLDTAPAPAWDAPSRAFRKSLRPLFQVAGEEPVLASQGWPFLAQPSGTAVESENLKAHLGRHLAEGHAQRLERAVRGGAVLLGLGLDDEEVAGQACRTLLETTDCPVELHDLRGRPGFSA